MFVAVALLLVQTVTAPAARPSSLRIPSVFVTIDPNANCPSKSALRLAHVKFPPAMAAANLGGEVGVVVNVDSGGKVISVAPLLSSGVAAFDKAAVLAARRTVYPCVRHDETWMYRAKFKYGHVQSAAVLVPPLLDATRINRSLTSRICHSLVTKWPIMSKVERPRVTRSEEVVLDVNLHPVTGSYMSSRVVLSSHNQKLDHLATDLARRAVYDACPGKDVRVWVYFSP